MDNLLINLGIIKLGLNKAVMYVYDLKTIIEWLLYRMNIKLGFKETDNDKEIRQL
jgi:hypothetical protein